MRKIVCLILGIAFLQAVRDEHTRGVAIIIALIVSVVLLLAYRRQSENKGAESTLFAALEAAMSRKYDVRWKTVYGPYAWWFVVWLPEKKIYFSSTKAPYDPANFYGADRIREWSIQKTREVSGRRYWDEYAVNISVRDTQTPLIKVFCGKSEALAYRICEHLNQMFEPETV